MKKFLMLLTTLLCIFCGALALAACGESANTGNSGHVHSFVNYVFNDDATCTEDGTETATCSCGETDTRTKINSALGHRFTTYVYNEDATCTENGTETTTCIRCSEQDTREKQNSALGHEWDDGVVTPATCTTPGQTYYTCHHNPEHHKTEEIQVDPSAHSYGDWIPQIDARCTEEGTLGHFECEYCHHNFDIDHEPLNDLKIEKIPHEYNEWQDEIPASCTAPGRRGYRECKNCHLKYDREDVLIEEDDLTIEQIDHKYEFDHAVTKTCQEAGYVVEKCSMCQGTQNVTVEDISLKAQLTRMAGTSLGSYGSFENTYTVYAEGGYGKLQYRAELYQSSPDIPSKVLDYSENSAFTLRWSGYDESDRWTLKVFCKDEAGNMTTARFSLRVDEFEFVGFDGNGGSIVRADLACLEQQVDEAHNYQGVKTDPTCTEQGYTTYTCADCQKDYVGDYVDPLGHEYQDDVCIRCSRHTGLLYVPSGDHCVLVSIGTCTETEIVIAENYEGLPVTEIGTKAFENEESIISVKIPGSVTVIGGSTFAGCSGLTSITIGNGVTSIGYGAFGGCSGLESVTFKKDSHLASIGYYAFQYCSKLTSIEIPKSVTSIGDYVFYRCSKLESVTFEKDSNLTSIGDSAFSYCYKLTRIEILKSVTSIRSEAFYGCSKLESVTFEKDSNLTSIGNDAFCNCNKLTSIEILKSVTSIGYSAFSDCSSLQSVTFEDPNGWSHGGTPIDPSLLQDPAVAAAYLSKTYCSETWKKTKEN